MTDSILRIRSVYKEIASCGAITAACALACLVSCDDDRPKPPLYVPPASVASVASALGVDAASLEAPSDPPAPAGDLRAEIERFTTIDACVKERAAIDPLIGDALEAIGYDTFVLDACRMLDAAKAKEVKRCAAIDASPLRARCESVVAIAMGDPDACPWLVPTRVQLGRDATCLAVTTRDARLCAALRSEAPQCEALVARDEKRCDALAREPARAHCRRDVKRFAPLLASIAADAATSTPIAVSAKLELHALEGTQEPTTANVDLRDDFARGVVLLEQLDGVRFDVGDLRELRGSTGFFAPQPLDRAHFGATLFVARGTANARIESTEVGVPSSATLVTPAVHSTVKATLAKLDHARGGEVKLVLEGEIGSSPRGYRVKVEIVTFVRDVVKPNAIPPAIPRLPDAGRR